MRKTRNVVLYVAVVLALLISACAPVAQTGAAGEPSSAATTDEQVTIRWWHIWPPETDKPGVAWQELADKYMAEHPNINIEITVIPPEPYKEKLATNMQAGDPPDLLQTWGGGVLWQYADAGLVQDLTDALAEDGWGDSFLPGPMAVYQHDGKIWGVPWTFGMVGMWYNTALFEEAGITETPKTWTEFLAVVEQLQAAGITPLAVGEKDKWPGHFWWSYLALRNVGQEGFLAAYNREGSFADPGFIAAGEQFQQLLDLEPFQEGHMEHGYNEQQVVMAKEEAAMELMGQWAFGANTGKAEDNLDNYIAHTGWFPFPMVEGGAGSPTDALGGGDGFAIGKNAPPETIEFVKFLTSAENQAAMVASGAVALPVVKGLEDTVQEPVMRTLFENFSEAEFLQLYLDQFLPPAVGLSINDYVQELFAGTKNAEEVAVAIEEVAELELAE